MERWGTFSAPGPFVHRTVICAKNAVAGDSPAVAGQSIVTTPAAGYQETASPNRGTKLAVRRYEAGSSRPELALDDAVVTGGRVQLGAGSRGPAYRGVLRANTI